jgi:hypothetical protein
MEPIIILFKTTMNGAIEKSGKMMATIEIPLNSE